MRKQRVVLKDGVYLAFEGRKLCDIGISDEDLALAGNLKTGNHAQQSGFTATAGSQKGVKLSAFDLQIHFVHRGETAKVFA